MKPDYGLDAPGRVRSFVVRGALLAALAIGLWIVNGPGSAPLFSVLIAIAIAYLAVSAVMYRSSRVGKLRMRDQILDELSWRGDEKVLDVGCGRGLFLIGAARRLKTGRATGIDIWRSEDLSGNEPEATLANAKAEGVADRVKIESGDAQRLPFPAGSFDVVLSSLAIHNIPDAAGREQAVAEMFRVLKPGGQLAILDIFHTREYAKELRKLGMADVKVSSIGFSWCCPTWHLTARKQ